MSGTVVINYFSFVCHRLLCSRSVLVHNVTFITCLLCVHVFVDLEYIRYDSPSFVLCLSMVALEWISTYLQSVVTCL